MKTEIKLTKQQKGYILTLPNVGEVALTDEEFQKVYAVLFDEHFKVEHAKMEAMKRK